MEYDRKEALRYFRASAKDKAAGLLVDTVYLKLRNEVQARHVLRRHGIALDATGVTLDCGVRFSSKRLAAHLKGCEEALLFGATLGSRVDIAIRRLALESVAEGAAAQAVAASLIESYCDSVLAGLDTGSLFARPRFSPGYGDWDLSEQRLLFRLLDCSRLIGLTLTDGLMMAPSKSVTAVIGLSRDPSCATGKCASCGKTDCPYREGN